LREQLLELLDRRSPQTTSELAKSIKGSWHRVQENLLELLIDGKIERMVVGGRYLWFSKKDKKVHKKGVSGMSPILKLAILFIGVLLISNIIFSTDIINDSNFSLNMGTTGNVVGVDQLQEQLKDIINGSPGNETSEEIVMPDNQTNDTLQVISELFENTNVTEMNLTINDAINSSIIAPEITKPVLNVEMIRPDNVSRGDVFVMKAIVTNTGTGTAHNIIVTWNMPEGFAISATNQDCAILEPGTSCTSLIDVQTNVPALPGENRIGVRVNYE
jgi:hypothetical protein